jgi:trans-2,3-dihydro-3-hydroxyanthranilate isomerase
LTAAGEARIPSAMKLQFHTLDVFTKKRFGGNPLAVVLGADSLSTAQMQTIAREFNLSETIFVQTPESTANTAKVRIFFPAGEMPFAGHPTLGCAVLLAEMNHKAGCSFETEIRLEEVAGLVPVKVTRIGDVPVGHFTAPVVPLAADGVLPSPQDAAAALGLTSGDIGFDGHRIGLFEGGPRFLYIPLQSRPALATARTLQPQWEAMTEAARVDNAYLYIRGGDKAETSFRSRMFAPAAGIPEDPATGSATAILAAQLLASGELSNGTQRFQLEQGYEMGRPSDLTLEADIKSNAIVAVRVGGSAVHVSEGTLFI